MHKVENTEELLLLLPGDSDKVKMHIGELETEALAHALLTDDVWAERSITDLVHTLLEWYATEFDNDPAIAMPTLEPLRMALLNAAVRITEFRKNYPDRFHD